MQICLMKRWLTAERVNEWNCGNKVKCQWTAACCWGSQIQCSTVAPWLMSVVSAPLDTRLLLCGLIQPHAIKQKSHCMQGRSGGMAQLRVSSILPSRLSSPPRLSGVHALLSRHTGMQHTHHREPRGLRCLEVNRIIWSCSVLTRR